MLLSLMVFTGNVAIKTGEGTASLIGDFAETSVQVLYHVAPCLSAGAWYDEAAENPH